MYKTFPPKDILGRNAAINMDMLNLEFAGVSCLRADYFVTAKGPTVAGQASMYPPDREQSRDCPDSCGYAHLELHAPSKMAVVSRPLEIDLYHRRSLLGRSLPPEHLSKLALPEFIPESP